MIEPEWSLLVDRLDAFYADKTTFVVVVAGCVQTWARCMFELLEDPVNEDWTEKVLEKVPVRMHVFVEVSATDNAMTQWSEQRDGFILKLPNKLVSLPAELFPVFRGQLLACFDTVTKKFQLPERGATAAASDDWEGVEINTTTGRAKVVESATKSWTVEFMPDAALLPRPDELFLKPPYHLTLLHGHQQVELHSSHSPTLEFIATYLKRWCRVNHTDTRKVSLASLDFSSMNPLLTAVPLAPRRPCDALPVLLQPGRDVRPVDAEYRTQQVHQGIFGDIAHDCVPHRRRARVPVGVCS